MVVREEEELGSEVGVLNRLASKAQEVDILEGVEYVGGPRARL